MKKNIASFITCDIVCGISACRISATASIRHTGGYRNRQQRLSPFRTALNDAREKNASLILLHLNTYGGALDAADSIRTAIMKLDMPTVAFVDVNAASAGALIALACDSVYMAPGASMGSATVVNSQGDPMPEKYQSFMSTMMRATAEHHGKNGRRLAYMATRPCYSSFDG